MDLQEFTKSNWFKCFLSITSLRESDVASPMAVVRIFNP